MKHPLHYFRLRQRLSQAQLAAMIGVSQGYIAHIENGRRRPSPDIAKLLEEMTQGEVSRNALLYPKEHTV
jgi:transcriptional regulator with XRE-family HTH domain